MTSLDDRISALETRIIRYETELDNATIQEEKNRLSGLITSARETLNRLLDEKKGQPAGHQAGGQTLANMNLPLPPPSAAVQPVAPVFPTHHAPQEEFILQLKFHSVDGTKFILSEYRGFRNFIVSKATEIGLKGYVWRIPLVHATIVAVGTEDQLRALLTLCKTLRKDLLIQAFTREKPERDVLDDAFVKLPSTRRHVRTGKYSDAQDDDVASTTSVDQPVLGAPSPHDMQYSSGPP
eukprot:scaffold2935_cov154-Ochromonas_danica.AAC.1